jgi:serine/threonine protein kinase
MQSSLEFFCEECGAANPDDATYCIACKELLVRPFGAPVGVTPIKPVIVAPPTTLQVVAGSTPVPALSEEAEYVSDILPPGLLLENRYRIEREIGQGGYSIVYKAADTARRGRAVTIKQINLRNLTSRQIIDATETFNRETAFLPTLKHSGIPHFYHHFTDPEHWYLVMEYIPGRTLEDYLQKVLPGGYCSVKDTLKIGIALSSILEYLHMQRPPVIFRDIKPANIMLTPGKKLYLIDFGIARSFHPGKAKDTTPLGSPGYAAPEQYGRSQSDARTDIYALGATLQTLLTGRDPLELRAQSSRAPRPIPRYVQTLLDSMQNPVASRRPYSMSGVRESLQQALARVRRLALYIRGLVLGMVYFLWGYLTWKFGTSPISLPGTYAHVYNNLNLLSDILWILTALTGIILLLVFLFQPARRYFAFGILTSVLLVIVLLFVGVSLSM